MQIFIEPTDMELWEIVNNGVMDLNLFLMLKMTRENSLTNQKINIQVLTGLNLPRIQELSIFFIVVWMLTNIIVFLCVI